MSFLTRVRLAMARWWIRNAEDRRRLQYVDDLEGMGRRLARPPLRGADDEHPPVSATVPVDRKRGAALPKQLVIRFDV